MTEIRNKSGMVLVAGVMGMKERKGGFGEE